MQKSYLIFGWFFANAEQRGPTRANAGKFREHLANSGKSGTFEETKQNRANRAKSGKSGTSAKFSTISIQLAFWERQRKPDNICFGLGRRFFREDRISENRLRQCSMESRILFCSLQFNTFVLLIGSFIRPAVLIIEIRPASTSAQHRRKGVGSSPALD